MIKKNISAENYFKRLQELADVKKPINEGLKNSTLVDYVRATNNVAYAIIKENHNYFIKTSNRQGSNLSVADFAYIGGIENRKEYQYSTVSEANKNRNFVLININEATKGLKTNGSKLVMNEDISNAQSAADKNTAKETMPKPISKPSNISVDGLSNSGQATSSTPKTEESDEKETTDESVVAENVKKPASLSVGGKGNTTVSDPSKTQSKADKNKATDSIPAKPSIPSNIIHDGKGNSTVPDASKAQSNADKNKATGSIPKAPAKPAGAIVVEDASKAQSNANGDKEHKAQKEADKSKSTTVTTKVKVDKIAEPVLKGQAAKTVYHEKAKTTKVNEAEDADDDINAAAAALDDLENADAAGKAASATANADDATDDVSNAASGVPAGDAPEGDSVDPTATTGAEDDSAISGDDTTKGDDDSNVDAFGNGSKESQDDKERKKYVGKLQNLATNSQLTGAETVADLKQILAGYKEALKGLDVDQRNEIISTIKKSDDGDNDEVDSNNDTDLDVTATNDEIGNDSGEEVQESAFHNHMSECGYDPADDKNISVMEMASIINSWANKLGDNNEDGDLETVAKYYSPDVEKEVNESGNGEFGEKIKPFVSKLGEDGTQNFGSFEPMPSSVDELFGDEETGEESEDDTTNSTSDLEDLDGKEDDTLEPVGGDKSGSFSSPAIMSTPTGNGSGTKSVSVDLKNQMVTMNVTESQIKKYIKNELEIKKGLKKRNVNEAVEIGDEKLKKEIDALINAELKETTDPKIDPVVEARLRNVIKSRIQQKFDSRKQTKSTPSAKLNEAILKGNALLKNIDECIEEVLKDRKKK